MPAFFILIKRGIEMFTKSQNLASDVSSNIKAVKYLVQSLNEFAEIKGEKIISQDIRVENRYTIGDVIKRTEKFIITHQVIEPDFESPLHIHKDENHYFIHVEGKMFIEVNGGIQVLSSDKKSIIVKAGEYHKVYTRKEKCEFILVTVPPFKEI